jgi:excisionase family DNA binding protein
MGCEVDEGMDLETAARVLRVHYQTAYRWVRVGILAAVKVDGEYRLAPHDVETLARLRSVPKPPSYTGRPRDWDRLREQLHAALVVGDETGARRVFERVRLAHVPLLEQCEELLAPAMRRIGEEWASGTLSGGYVRAAAGICERSLDWAVSCLTTEAGPLALVVTPEGDGHRLPALMARAVLREGGWAVHNLEGLPAADIVALAHGLRPAVAVISGVFSAASEAAADLGRELERALALPVLVGGAGEPLAALAEDTQVLGTALTGRAAQPPAA